MGKGFLKNSLVLSLVVANFSCAGVSMKSAYPKASVQPVVVELPAANELTVTYQVPPESVMYSKGVDYSVDQGQLRVVIVRCHIKDKCTPMATSVIPLDGRWQAKVKLPYHGEKVIMVYNDSEEQVYP